MVPFGRLKMRVLATNMPIMAYFLPVSLAINTVGGKMVRVFSKILQKKEYTGNYESYQRQTSFIRKHKLLLMHFLNFALIG
jgi:hypothetical protein